MTERTLNYNYDVTVNERYYMKQEEAVAFVEAEQKKAFEKNHALIMTGKGYENRSFFDAFTAKRLSHNFTWIHFCPQEILNFDDEEPQEGNYYISVMEGTVKKIKK